MKAGGYREEALLIPGGDHPLIGVLSQPVDGAAPDLAVVIVVGGPQVRAGSHRQFVLLARRLAQHGYPALRFDVGGMGDSPGPARSFEALAPDIGAAIDGLTARQPGLRRIVLWGLCDGASAALLYLQQRPDPRVAGLCLVNPWVRSEATLARTQVKHYYRDRLRQKAFWLKLLRGGVALAAVQGLWQSWRKARRTLDATGAGSYQDRMAAAWRAFSGPVQLVLSGRDYTAREFVEYADSSPAWAGLRTGARVSVYEPAEADHTFSTTTDQAALELAVVGWLDQRLAPSA